MEVAAHISRILLVNIRNMSEFPCPRCKVPMDKIYLIGSKMDRRNRARLKRSDSHAHQEAVSAARAEIYKNNHPVTSIFVTCKLKDPSLVPATVSL